MTIKKIYLTKDLIVEVIFDNYRECQTLCDILEEHRCTPNTDGKCFFFSNTMILTMPMYKGIADDINKIFGIALTE